MADHKFNLNINSGGIRYLGFHDITNYRLEFISQKFETTDPI